MLIISYAEQDYFIETGIEPVAYTYNRKETVEVSIAHDKKIRFRVFDILVNYWCYEGQWYVACNLLIKHD